MRLRSLASTTLAMVVACASAPPPPTTPEPSAVVSAVPANAASARPRMNPPPGASTLLVAGALVEVTRARSLDPQHAVPGIRVSRAELLARVKAHVAREVPAIAIRAAGDVQKLLGLFPTGDDFEATTYAMLEAGMTGYYEPDDGTMYLVDDVYEADRLATLWHELVHALQDQRWDLQRRMAYVPGDVDRSDATSALAEGDATSASTDMLLTYLRPDGKADGVSDDVLADHVARSMDTGKTAAFPRSMRRSVLAPYLEGMRFVNALRRDAGWRAVDEAWETPPVTTEQILHIEKWRAHEPPIALEDPPAPAAARPFQLVDAATYGELELRLAFEGWMPPAAAKGAASGWGGDRLALFASEDGAVAMAWHVRFDDASPNAPDAFASRAFDALAAALPRLGRVADRSRDRVCVDRKGNGALLVARGGRDLFLVVGSVTPRPEGWRAQMTCADAITWSEAARATR